MRLAMVAPSTTGIIGTPLAIRDTRITEEWVVRWHDTAKQRSLERMAPELSIHEFKDLKVIGPEQYIVSADGEVLTSENFLIDFSKHRLDANRELIGKYQGTKLVSPAKPTVLYQGHGTNVYGHVLVEMLPRLALLRLAGFDLKAFNYLIRADTAEWHRKLLSVIFDITTDQLIEFDSRNDVVSVPNAIVPTLPRGQGGIHPAAAVLFDLLSPSRPLISSPRTLNLLIERPPKGNNASFNRSISNYDQLAESTLNYFTYTKMEPSQLSFHNQVDVFRNANIIVGEYGSALHNVVFSHRQPLCICIGHINLLQSTLCALRGSAVAYLSTDVLKKEVPIDIIRYEELLQLAQKSGILKLPSV